MGFRDLFGWKSVTENINYINIPFLSVQRKYYIVASKERLGFKACAQTSVKI